MVNISKYYTVRNRFPCLHIPTFILRVTTDMYLWIAGYLSRLTKEDEGCQIMANILAVYYSEI